MRWILLSVALLASSSVLAQEGWYVAVNAGLSNARDPEVEIPSGPLPADLGESPSISAGVGYAVFPGLRTEGIFTYRFDFEHISGFPEMPTGRGNLSSWSMISQLAVDLFSLPNASPYASFGAGFAQNRLGTLTITNPDGSLFGTIAGKTRFTFAWQWGAGVSVSTNKRIHLDFGYRSFHGGEYESEDLLFLPDGTSLPGKDVGHLGTNEWIAGLRIAL